MGRTYEIGEAKYPSVTSILSEYGNKDGLIQWSANCVVDYIKDHLEDIRTGAMTIDDIDLDHAKQYYKEKSGEACNIGSSVHHYIEQWIKKELGLPYSFIGVDAEAEKSVQAFYDWEKENNFLPYASEMTVYSHANRYAGTLDCLARVNGKIVVLDIKTSKRHDPINSVQIAAYRKALVEMIATKRADVPIPRGCAVLRLDKITGKPDYKDYSDKYKDHWQVFKRLIEAFYLFKKRRCGK